MCKTINVELCQVPLYRLSIQTKRMVWYRAPLSNATVAKISIFNTPVSLAFSNSHNPGPRQAVYGIPDQQSLNQFYQTQLIIQFADSFGHVFGISRFSPRIFSKDIKEKKGMICPVLSCQMANEFGCPVKLGDIQLKVSVNKASCDIDTLKRVKSYLDDLQNRPEQLRKLYNNLKKQKYI